MFPSALLPALVGALSGAQPRGARATAQDNRRGRIVGYAEAPNAERIQLFACWRRLALG